MIAVEGRDRSRRLCKLSLYSCSWVLVLVLLCFLLVCCVLRSVCVCDCSRNYLIVVIMNDSCIHVFLSGAEESSHEQLEAGMANLIVIMFRL